MLLSKGQRIPDVVPQQRMLCESALLDLPSLTEGGFAGEYAVDPPFLV